ncbi:MAG: MFS transporter, partial [Trueperaceae bacterium]|nr:MFS transporter [Trueperaceae bacterium]
MSPTRRSDPGTPHPSSRPERPPSPVPDRAERPPPPPGSVDRLADLDPATRRDVRRTMRWAVVEGSLAQVFLNWTQGSVLVGFLLHLEATPAELALVASMPHLSQLASPLAAYLAAALGRRRLLVAAMGLASRLTWLLAATLPLWPVPDAARPPLMIAIVLFSSLFLASQNTLWTAWMGDVVPERERGRVFGMRTGLMGVVGMAANLAVGAFLDAVAAPISFQVALAVAVAVGLLGVAVYALQLDPPTAIERVRWRELLTVPWRDVGFRRYLRFTLYWNCVVVLSGPFVTPYYLQELRMTFTQVAIVSGITASTAVATTPLWGRVTDRRGHKPVLALGTFLVGLLLPTSWILAGLTGSLAWIWGAAVADAVAWGRCGSRRSTWRSAPRRAPTGSSSSGCTRWAPAWPVSPAAPSPDRCSCSSSASRARRSASPGPSTTGSSRSRRSCACRRGGGCARCRSGGRATAPK